MAKLTKSNLIEIIESRASGETQIALQSWAVAELARRTTAGQKGGRPRSPIDAAIRNREAVRKYRAKNK